MCCELKSIRSPSPAFGYSYCRESDALTDTLFLDKSINEIFDVFVVTCAAMCGRRGAECVAASKRSGRTSRDGPGDAGVSRRATEAAVRETLLISQVGWAGTLANEV